MSYSNLPRTSFDTLISARVCFCSNCLISARWKLRTLDVHKKRSSRFMEPCIWNPPFPNTCSLVHIHTHTSSWLLTSSWRSSFSRFLAWELSCHFAAAKLHATCGDTLSTLFAWLCTNCWKGDYAFGKLWTPDQWHPHLPSMPGLRQKPRHKHISKILHAIQSRGWTSWVVNVRRTGIQLILHLQPQHSNTCWSIILHSHKIPTHVHQSCTTCCSMWHLGRR